MLDTLHNVHYLTYMSNKSYVLRDIPEALWREVKAQAAERGITIGAAILALLEKWVKDRGAK